jgi:GT2 family glycosyltransferase
MTVPEPVPRVSAVVLAWQAEPWLRRGVHALLAAEKVDVDVVLVDNGCTTDDVTELEHLDRVTVVRPGRNLGFAAGCNAGAAAGTGEYLALVNGDAIVEPTALVQLVEALGQPDTAIAGASIRLADDPRLLNSGGNPVHVLGVSWVGRLGEPETRVDAVEVPVASGACLLVRQALWREFGGFDPEYFAYHEDTELSLRAWRTGRRVLYVPGAVAVHRYEMSRNPAKLYLVERNRLMLVATVWSARGLVLLAPALALLEAGTLVLAARQGWFGAKLRGWRWLWAHRSHLRQRRRLLQAERVVPDAVWMARLTDTFDISVLPMPGVVRYLNLVLRGYWRLVRRFL